MRIDSHHHLWRYDVAQYPWMQEGWPIRRDFLPPDLRTELNAAGIDGCVAVQARQSLEETRWLLELADVNPWILGVVGWVDLRAGGVARQLRALAGHPKLVGVRHVAQDEPDDRFLVGTEFMRGVAELQDLGLAYDLLVFPRQLPACVELAERFPQQRFVLDHVGKPSIRDGQIEPWAGLVRRLAGLPNVMCKLSGLVTEAHWERWQPGDFFPFIDVVWDAFGAERLMYGSDWPVCLLAGSYARVHGLARDAVARRLPTAADADGFWGGNAMRFYRLTTGGKA